MMIECAIQGCGDCCSTLVSPDEILKRWVILKACQCRAWDGRLQKSCTCSSDFVVPTTFWPNLDWWMLGGVESVTLCPKHKLQVLNEIVRQQIQDPSMDVAGGGGGPNYGNRH